jgi:aminoglycoside 3-N-acetyltransferase
LHSQASLTCDLIALGIAPGDIVFMHSSFKSLGEVDGGAGAVVGALMDALGETGLLLMPSFNLVDREERAATWDVQTTPSTVGWITEYFWRMPGTMRSDHYSHSVAARGHGAGEFVDGKHGERGLDSPWDREPWGKTYGVESPMYMAYEEDGKLLMLGVDYHSSTYVHLVEVMFWNRRRLERSGAEYIWLDRDKLGEWWDRNGRLNRGRVGDAECRLFSIRDYVDALLQEVERHPERYGK